MLRKFVFYLAVGLAPDLMLKFFQTADNQISVRRVIFVATILMWVVYSFVNNEPSWQSYFTVSAIFFLVAVLIIADSFLPEVTPKEPFKPELVAGLVGQLFSKNQTERSDAIRILKHSNEIFADYGQALSNKNAFFAIETLAAICLEKQKPLFPETVEFFYEIMMADAFDANYEGESVSQRVKRILLPLCPSILAMEERFGKALTLDSTLVRYWLKRPTSDWDWLMPGVNHSMIIDCQNRRKAGY